MKHRMATLAVLVFFLTASPRARAGDDQPQPPPCPACGEVTVLPVINGGFRGFTDEERERARRGEAVLGDSGCVGERPDWACQKCGKRWGSAQAVFCSQCQNFGRSGDTGRCRDCGNETNSSSLRICASCAGKKGICQDCLKSVKQARAPEKAPKPDTSTPENAWQAILNAMRRGDIEKLAMVTTKQGLNSFSFLTSIRDETRAQTFQRLGEGWANYELRWHAVQEDRAAATMGPEEKENSLEFIRTSEGWRLDRWMPGK